MISVAVRLSPDNLIGALDCSGHAGFSWKGTDLVCAAFTILLRTFVRTCERLPEAGFQVREDRSGSFRLQFDSVPSDNVEQFRGSCWFFLQGVDDLARDFPEQVSISYSQASGR
ncbi:MAG: ribosomal-processing cysteine protease Prp [Spirochaetales bacterium]